MCKICKLFSGRSNFSTRTYKGLLSLLLIMTAHTACIDESEDFQQLQGNHLDIQVGIQETANSRAVITGNNLTS